MSFVTVSPGDLAAGSSMVRSGAGGGASANVGSLAGAAASTPIAPAWDAFVEHAGTASIALDEVVIGLADALASAGHAYPRSDTTAATGLGPNG